MTRAVFVSGERLVLRARPHWIGLLGPLLPAGASLGLLMVLAPALHVSADFGALIVLCVTFVCGCRALPQTARWMTTDVLLTDRRVILRAGLVTRSTKVIALDRIQDVSSSSSMLGRLLGFGQLEIDAAGAGGHEIVAGVTSPGQFRDQLFLQAQRWRPHEGRRPA